ncbi:hypothetical protein HYW44_00820 [Candidatus Daviesbacteria bacterium]|nr:hypothetical protein [Candidatus Daviesbacteria bacterium]
MPNFEVKNIDDAFREAALSQSGYGKFVREGELIFWDAADFPRHKIMLLEAGFTQADDAGRYRGLIVNGERIFSVYQHSPDLELPKTAAQRNTTLEKWREAVKGKGYRVEPDKVEDIMEIYRGS